jgi:aspartate racemase
MWLLDRLAPESPTYNIVNALRLCGPLDVGALHESLEEIVRRHEVLRTTFAAVDGTPVQTIAPSLELGLPLEDLTALPRAARGAEARRIVREEARRPFDLAQGPLFRAKLLGLGQEEHVLLVGMHHIVSDGWSLGIFWRELGALYEAFSEGKPSPLPDPPIQYADYAVWQRRRLTGEVLDEQLGYWRRRLADVPTLELPTDRPRPAVQTHRGARQKLELSEWLTERLKDLSRQEGVTLFMVLLAAFQVLLSRYSGQDDVAIGTPIANRNRAETEGLIGFFVNTLVMRTDLSGEPSFRALLGRVREVALGAYANQDLPFERLVEELQPTRDPSQSPLFQVAFALQNVPTAPRQLAGLTTARMDVDNQTATFDLTLFMWEKPEGLRGTLEYNTDLFDAASIARMLGNFHTLLEGVVADPEQRISELELLTEAERDQLLVGWNGAQTLYPKHRCIHELFEEQAERSPDAVAVLFEERRLSYRSLNERANQLARHLRRLGVGPEVRVGLCVERSPEMVVAMLGILKAGGAYVPLDPSYPSERLAFMLEDAQASVLVSQRHLLDSLPRTSARVVCVDADRKVIAQEDVQNPDNKSSAESLAYVIYTSGSTGKPKGVCVPHRAVIRLVSNTDYARLTSADVVGQASNAAFDAATWEIWGALLGGARLVVLPQDTVLSPRALAVAIEQRRISALFLTTALFNQMARENPAAFRPLRHLLFGGEAVKTKWVREVLDAGPPDRLLHVYGPTETTTFATWHLVEDVEDDATTIPIGRPIANTEAYVLDARSQLVPAGVPGELYIGGPGVARGYLNRRHLTDERFVPHPFSEQPDARLYRTGDRVRRLANGDIEFLGRLDGQVKLRGFRIEPGEIESVLNSHAAVRESVVLLREDTPEQKRLAAYLVAAGAAPPHSELRAFMRQRLPDYMIPATFVALEALPLTPNGKIDRDALPAPGATRPDPGGEPLAPRDELEKRLVGIWEQVLGVPVVGVNDDFFELGGHSLLAVNLFVQIEKVFGRQLPLATLFRAPTVGQLAEVLREETEEEPHASLVAIQPHGSRPPFFCVHGAGGEVLLYQRLARYLKPDQPFYGFQAKDLDKMQAALKVEDMAASYLRELREFQPEGPYYLGGYSSGGLVAFEMARRLRAQDHSVALLALFDTAHPRGFGRRPLSARLYHHARSLRRQGPLRYAEETFWMVIRRRIRRLANKWSLWTGHPLPYALRRNRSLNRMAAANYEPQPYPERVTLFRSADFWGPSGDPSLGWSSIVGGGVDVHEVPGDHRLFREPHVQVLAARLQASLEQTQPSSP